MSGLAIFVPGSGPGTGPIIPQPLHPTGVSTEYVNRYVASEFAALADATNIASVTDYGSRKQALMPTSGHTVRKQRDATAAVDYLELIAPASASAVTLAAASAAYDADICHVLVARRVDSAMRLASGGNGTATINGDGTLSLARGGASGTGPAFPTSWAFVLVQFSGLNWTARVNGTETSGTLGGGNTNPSAPSLGGNGGIASTKTVHVIERISFTATFGTTQRDAIRAAMKAKYPFLP